MFNKEKIYPIYLLYDQKMHFSSIEEIVLYLTNEFSNLIVEPYKVGSIDEYNRLICNVDDKKALKLLISQFQRFNINVTDNLTDLEKARKSYISFKWPKENCNVIIKEWEELNKQGQKIFRKTQPIILNIPGFLNEKEHEKIFILCILYDQYYNWKTLYEKLDKIYKKYANKPLAPGVINKYNRVFFKSKRIEDLEIIKNDLEKEKIRSIILNSPQDFMLYRVDFIRRKYNDPSPNDLNNKWKYEYYNGWIGNDKIDPVIIIDEK